MVASSFAQALALTLKFEGGYGDNPSDPGGATNMGITQATLEDFRGHKVTKADVKALTLEEASAIYRKNYWNAILGDLMPAGVDMCLFDCAVNSGVERTVKLLQSALGLRLNGILSDATVKATLRASPPLLITALCRSRLSFLERLATFANFGRGWSKRIIKLEIAAKQLVQIRLIMPVPPPQMKGGETPLTPPPTQQELPMSDVKSLLQSRTIWSNLIGFGAFALAHFGLKTSGIDQSQLTDSVLQIVTASSFVASSFFRLIASKKLV